MAKYVSLKVFYTKGESSGHYDPGFQQQIEWDIPLLEGYDFEFLNNTSRSSGSQGFFGVDNNQDAIQKITAFKPTAILVYGWANKSHLKILMHFHGKIKVLFRGDSTLLQRLPWYKAIMKRELLRWVYKHVNTALYVGSHNKGYFLKYGLKEAQLAFAPHAVDNARFKSCRIPEAMALRQSFGVREEEILILFAGKLTNIKNPLLLLNAFADINPRNAHLLFVGNGHLEQQLRCNASDVASKVHFLPFQNQRFMPVIYQSCDLFCMPSRSPGESWGLAISEAMAAGKAILSSSMVGAAADLVTRENGRIFKSGDYKQLKSNLVTLISDKNKLKVLGDHSSRIIADWSFERQIKMILAHV
jgi:glycosyltransferase involved in cell wall biosynthesis